MARNNNNSLPEDSDQTASIPHSRTEPRPDFTQPPPKKTLPKEIQDNLDSDERLWAIVSSGQAEDTTDSNLRYAAYANRIRTIMMSAHRYVAYTSEVGESFRPVAHPLLVRSAYAISWAYIVGDVGYEGYKAYIRQYPPKSVEKAQEGAVAQTQVEVAGKVPAIDDYRVRMIERFTFQSIASMGLPAFTIHSIVKYSGKAFKNVKNVKIRTWGPVGLGLAAVPALPYLFDKPVEHATEWVFHNAFEMIGGPGAVGKDLKTGLASRPEKEKEL